MTKQTVVLTILDGWGYREEPSHNAIAAAATPTWDSLWQQCPHALIGGSGAAVGLPDGQMGNSEVGHMNIGAGRIVYQDYTRINHAIAQGEFQQKQALLESINSVKHTGNCLHIMGLLSPGGVHSHENHILAMVEMAAQQGCSNVALHVFLDGRDTPPQSALASIQRLEQCLLDNGCAPISSIIGRYFAMDRDNRWDRVAKAYALLTDAKAAFVVDSATKGLEQAYARGETDEFVQATWVKQGQSIQDGDAVVFMNFRSDRARQLSRAFTEPQFSEFPRAAWPQLANFVTLTQYAATINAQVAFAPANLTNTLGAYLAQHDMQQLRIAETEKYAHVTFFFNGGVEAPYPGEDRQLIPSPNVAHYDLQPEMSAYELTDALTTAITSGQYDFIVCNYANPDMVGHTGNFDATVKAIEVIDNCLARVVTAVQAIDGSLLITADHGNAEKMFDVGADQAHTAHTSEPVPLVYVGRLAKFKTATGALCDLAPTVLGMLKLAQPQEMTGQCLLQFDL